MTENKRFKLLYSQLDNGMFVDKEKQFEDIIVDKEFQKIGLIKLVDLLNKLADENRQLKHEIEDFQELLAIKEREEFLKPIIQQIEEARERERTNLGKSVIQQLLEQLQ